ncbi:DEAD/DEAH box helicase [Azospirillum sp. RWY-5-1]|uniref:DEAD/DEAH box helicase n=1 Tax=Azospirillum oleiclasticum TaxID=2735135 RepID=A0ABX2TA21_9PROT|nr:DEAD/DEAH box helicase [Azospirillum oleiclasticum]NYZ13984.1 DEAD/DEAH box helicase [Azospirillum oleiclasticum]NYZ20907.1 DEAD/DEAH box helicase [Azospirillum oleiclasticum]
MTVFLHLAFGGGRLHLWGEAPAAQAAPLPRPRGRRPKGGRAEPTPFDPGAESLDEALDALGIDLPVEPDRLTVWLPTADGRPLASTPVVAEPPEAADAPDLAPWDTTGFALPVEAAIDALCRCGGEPALAPGLFAGADFAYWAVVLRFAGALVGRRAVLPTLVREAGGAVARWLPVLLGRDAQALARLARAMPDAARAAGTAVAPPDTAPMAVLATVLDGFVDALVRGAPGLAPLPASTVAPTVADDRWLAALVGSDPRVRAEATDLADLERRLSAWQRPVAVAAASPVRLCLRLEEPPAPADPGDGDAPSAVAGSVAPWTVRLLVQSHADPSLLLPAAQAWAGNGGAGKGGAGSREYLLQAFAQAGRLWPPLEAALKAGVPDAVETDAAGAVAFLTTAAVALEQAGFGVLLPAWWTGRGTKARISARAKARTPAFEGGAGIGLDELVHFDWEVALGDAVLSRRDLMALAKLKTPLVRVRGQWVLVDPAEIKAAVERLKTQGDAVSARDLLRMALGGATADEPAAVATGGWLAELIDRLTGREPMAELDAPAGLAATLRPYQRRGYSWLAFLRRWGIGACLADDMGLGKTVQTLALLVRDKEEAATERRPRPTALLVCPTSVIGNWQREAARFAPGLSVMVHHGLGRTKGAALRKTCLAHDLVVTSYALLQRDAEALAGVPWTGLVLDEAQNIKNPETRQAKAVCALPPGYRVALTGTPVENNVGDLWGILDALNPGLLGTRAAFKRNFFVPIQVSRDADAIARLKSLTGPFILRRLKSDKTIIADLPDKLEMKVVCTLTKEQASLYQAVVEESLRALEEEDGIRRRGLVLALLARLKQICNHPAQYLGDGSPVGGGRSGKLARLEEMLEEVLAVGERALVFTQFTEMGGMIKAALQDRFGREVPFLHGGVPKAKRDRMVERFQAEDGPAVFLLSLKAGGTGLTLTRASHVFHFDRWWNPAVENQATDRAYRIGQTRMVEVHKFLCAGTLEERIDAMIEAKKGVAEAIVGSGEDWLTELSTADLRALLSLRADAVA